MDKCIYFSWLGAYIKYYLFGKIQYTQFITKYETLIFYKESNNQNYKMSVPQKKKLQNEWEYIFLSKRKID